MQTYADYQQRNISEKIGLVTLEASKRLTNFTLHSGFVYKLTNFDHTKLVKVQELDTEYEEAFSVGTLSSGYYFHDKANKTLYIQTTDDSHPNTKYIFTTFLNFFANVPVHAPYDLGSGEDVMWLPYLLSTSDFSLQLDSSTPQVGKAIEGAGSIKFLNQRDYFGPIFDRWFFENHVCKIYSWNRELDITEAKIIFRGRVQKKSWSEKEITFQVKDFLNELNQEIELANLEDVPGAIIPEDWNLYKQRRIYGYVYGHKPHNIDHLLETGRLLTGTITLVNGSSIVNGIGTNFLQEVEPEDEIVLDILPDEKFSVQSIQSLTQLTLSSDFDNETQTNTPFKIIAKNGTKRYANRIFKVAGHALREPSTTVSQGLSLRSFRVSDPSDFREGDAISVGTESAVIEAVVGDRIDITGSLIDVPSIGTTVLRPSIINVKIDNRLLVKDRDYTVDSVNALLTLDEMAEVNITPTTIITGTTISFTSGLRTVTGVGTIFKTDLKPGDFVTMAGHLAEYFEVLQITDDTNLELKTPATFSDTQAPYAKKVTYYKEEETVLSCDVMGKESSGSLIKTHAGVVEDIVTNDALLGDFLNAASITKSKIDASQLIGMVIPKQFDDENTVKIRDLIDSINKSCFGSFIQNADFELEFIVLKPYKPPNLTRIREQDVFKFTVETDSTNLFREIRVNYLFKEHNPEAGNETKEQKAVTSKDGTYLAKSVKDYEVDTFFVDENDADVFAKRLALFFERAQATIKIDSNLKLARMKVTDPIDFSHEKLFQRFGSIASRKVANLNLLSKSISDTTIEIQDLNNTLTRVATITTNDSANYADATEDERVINGYIVEDDTAIIPSENETFGLNLIW